MRQIIAILVGFLLIFIINNYSFAETRAHPYSEEFLLNCANFIFIGKVTEVEVFQRQHRSVPKKAQVILNIKGELKPGGIIDMIPKHPGGYVYFIEEFDQGKIGDVGIFYIGSDIHGPEVLIKYKKIPSDWK
ncbi:MAG: hypothetical protein AB1629_03700 [Candidatus Omnitrophota bacterium]